ncbi:O-methyltransferase [Lentzea sp. E54]|uniref:O-methyltransferase n=1 Tax=Lentzea xerophila TaxID=3435883 RepID=UPI003DA6AFBD
MTSTTIYSSSQVDKRVRLTSDVVDYALAHTTPPTAAQRWLIDTTMALGDVAEMQVPHEQAVLLGLLTATMRARTVIEIGTFTGYSALAMARNLPDGGTVHTFDISAKWAATADRAWRAAGVADRIRQHIGRAAQLLTNWPITSQVDLAFIDADKINYTSYWNLLVPRMADNGLILADNVLYAGEAVHPEAEGNAKAIREFNELVHNDHRVEAVLLPFADGLTVARKRPTTS